MWVEPLPDDPAAGYLRRERVALIVSTIMSLDGYSEAPGANVMVLPMDAAAEIMLCGATTDRGFQSFWPTVDGNPQRSATNWEQGQLLGSLPKLVISDTLTLDGPYADSTRVLARADAHCELAAYKEEGDGEIVVFGSRTLWHDLLAAGLVDEVHLMVGAVVPGCGTPALRGKSVTLDLGGTRTFPIRIMC